MIRGDFLGCRSDPKLSLPLSCVRPQPPPTPASPGPFSPCCLCSSCFWPFALLHTLTSCSACPRQLFSLDLSCIIIWSFPARKGSLPTVCSHVSVPIPGALISVAMSSLLNCQLHDCRDYLLLTHWSPAPHPCPECRKGSVDARGKGVCPQWWSHCSSLPASLCSGLYTTLRHLFLKHISDHLIAWWWHF